MKTFILFLTLSLILAAMASCHKETTDAPTGMTNGTNNPAATHTRGDDTTANHKSPW